MLYWHELILLFEKYYILYYNFIIISYIIIYIFFNAIFLLYINIKIYLQYKALNIDTKLWFNVKIIYKLLDILSES